MKIPSLDWLLGYGDLAAEIVGTGVGIARWRTIDRGRRFLVIWLAASALADFAEFVFAPIWHNVQPIARVWYAASVIFAVAALAAYQHDRRRARLFHMVVVAYLAAWSALVLTLDPLQRYSTYLGPLQGVIILAAAAATMFRRVVVARRDLLTDPGFVVAAALGVYALPAAFRTLVAQLWLNQSNNRVITFYAVCSVVSIFSVLGMIDALLIRGVPAPGRNA